MNLDNPPPSELRAIRLELSPDERTALSSALKDFQSMGTEDIFLCGDELAAKLPTRLLQTLALLKDRLSGTALLHLSGLPTSKVTGFEKEGYTSEFLLAAVAHALGRPFVAKNHRDGSPFLNLIPKRADFGKQLGTGTELEWHTEDAHLDDAARFICLLGLRADPDAKTLVSLLNASTLPKSENTNILHSQNILIRSDASYTETALGGAPTLSDSSQDMYRIRFDPEFTLYPGAEIQHALDEFKDKLEETAYVATVGPGDLLIFNNFLCAHKRTDFRPSFTDTDRWVQRIMVI